VVASTDRVATPGAASVDLPLRRPRRRHLPLIAGVAGVVLFGVLAVISKVVADQNEQRLLDQQADEAGAALSLSIGEITGPLNGAALAAAATDGDPRTFERIVTPLLTTEVPGYRSFTLYDLASSEDMASVGAEPELVGSGAVEDLLSRARATPFVVVDLLQQPARGLGYAVTDDPEAPSYVVYAERALSVDPTVRRRNDAPFSDIDYALYLGGQEVQERLLGSSGQDLPLDGRRATNVIPYGDQEILLVATPIGRLGGWLIGNLWWIVAVVGVLGTAGIVWLLRRLQRTREFALDLAEVNARKHDEQREIAVVLQRSLLPERLDAAPQTTMVARYWPAGEATLIGGDFYDAFRIDDDRWGIVIGDVCGKGIEAAALTGLVRHTIRSASRTATSPSDVLRAVHEAMLEHEPPTFCTVCAIVYRPTRGPDAGELEVALGGHPEPLLLRAGQLEPLGSPGTVLGMVEPEVHDERAAVHAGDTLILFTDGLTDAPGEQAVSFDELQEVVALHLDDDVDQLADAIGVRKRSRRPGGSSDDTALLVVRFGAAGGDPSAESADRSGAVVEPVRA
jgi:serine phosphatase RsbU (regulator of sigma subunit)